MTNRLVFSWDVDGFFDEQKYYCSLSPILTTSPPPAKATLANHIRNYTDTDISINQKYYVRFSSIKNNFEKFSNQIEKCSYNISTISDSLFSSSEKGFSYDFTDISKMFKDISGAENVLSVGDKIAYVLDLSGNGKNLIQGNESFMPILGYDQDKDLYFADFSGGKWMSSSTPVDLLSVSKFDLYAAIKKLDLSLSVPLELSQNLNENMGAFGLIFNPDGTSSFSTSGTGIGFGYISGSIQAPNGGSHYVSLDTNLTTNKIQKFKLNGEDKTVTSRLDNTTQTLIQSTLYVGCRAGSSLFSNSIFYSLIGIGRNTTTEEESLINNLQAIAFS